MTNSHFANIECQRSIRARTRSAVNGAMATPEADPETSAAGAQLVRREELHDLVQSLVQHAAYEMTTDVATFRHCRNCRHSHNYLFTAILIWSPVGVGN